MLSRLNCIYMISLSAVLTCSGPAFAARCESILRGVLYEDDGTHYRSPLYDLRVTELIKNDVGLSRDLRQRPRHPVSGAGARPTGEWRATFAPADERGPDLTAVTNHHEFASLDPVYGALRAELWQDLVEAEVSTPEIRDSGPFEDLTWGEMEAFGDLVRALANPANLEHLVTLVPPGAAQRRVVNVPAMNSDETLEQILARRDLPRLLGRLGFPSGTEVDVEVRPEGARSRLSLRGLTGAEAEFQFALVDGHVVVERIRLSRQVRRARSTLTLWPEDGDLTSAAARLRAIHHAEVAARLAAIRLDEMKRAAATAASDGRYRSEQPDRFGLKNYGGELMVVAIPDSRVQTTSGAVEFRLADAPRPQIITLGGLAFQVSYLRSGVLMATSLDDERIHLSGTYDKTPEEVTLEDGTRAVVTLLDVTLHEDARQVLKRARDIRDGRR